MVKSTCNRAQRKTKFALTKFAEFISTNGWQDIPRSDFTAMAISVMAFEIKKLINVPEETLNGHIVKLKTKSEIIFAIAG